MTSGRQHRPKERRAGDVGMDVAGPLLNTAGSVQRWSVCGAVRP